MTALSLSDASHLLQRFLDIGGWTSRPEAIAEAFPHLSQTLDPDEIVQSLEHLQVPHVTISCFETDITAEECPALVFAADGACYLALGRDGERLIIDSSDRQLSDSVTIRRARKAKRQRCLLIRIERQHLRAAGAASTTVAGAFAALPTMLPWLLAASFFSNLLGLMAPLLIMAIYDRVIPTGSRELLVSLSLGVGLILAADFGFRRARTKALAFIGSRGEKALTLALFRKFMALPAQQVTKSDAEQQLSRFRQFEALREVFTGQVMTNLLDLPFALIFFLVLLYLAPSVGILTLCAVVVFALMSALSIAKQTRLDKAASGSAAAARQVFQDAVHHQSAIAHLGLAEALRKRGAVAVAEAETASRKARQFQNTIQNAAQTVLALSTAGAIIFSTYAALDAEMSFGALIAVIALVSKVLAPIHGLHSNLPQLLSFLQSRKQVDRVLALPEEVDVAREQSHQKSFVGAVSFSGVSYRPDPLNAPLLSQVSFKVEPNETVLVMGSDVAGRTAMLDLTDGLFEPLAGTIEHDEIDIRQIARDELRRSISYATYDCALFHGTVAQNLRLAAPSISDAAIEALLDRLHLINAIRDLPDGIDTRLTQTVISGLPEATRKALCLARALAREAPIYLFSEPTTGLGELQRIAFRDWLSQKRGTATVLIATADRSLISMADRFLFLDSGRLTVNDTSEAGAKKIHAVLQNLGG